MEMSFRTTPNAAYAIVSSLLLIVGSFVLPVYLNIVVFIMNVRFLYRARKTNEDPLAVRVSLWCAVGAFVISGIMSVYLFRMVSSN